MIEIASTACIEKVLQDKVDSNDVKFCANANILISDREIDQWQLDNLESVFLEKKRSLHCR